MDEERIVTNPRIMAGKPVIRGTRIPVDAIIRRLAEGMSVKEILMEYPNLKEEDIKIGKHRISTTGQVLVL